MLLLHLLAVMVIQPNVSILSNGVYTADNGLKLQLLGATIASSQPFDAMGKPLSKEDRKVFDCYREEKLFAGSVAGSKPGKVIVYAVFAIAGPDEKALALKLTGPPFRSDLDQMYSLPDPTRGRTTKSMVLRFPEAKKAKQIFISFSYPADPYQTGHKSVTFQINRPK